jgi:hypothetical protein
VDESEIILHGGVKALRAVWVSCIKAVHQYATCAVEWVGDQYIISVSLISQDSVL